MTAKRCTKCGKNIGPSLRDSVPDERCSRCSGAKVESKAARRAWPRLVGLVALHVGSSTFADRIVANAAAGDELYTKLVREAWRKRRIKRWQKSLA